MASINQPKTDLTDIVKRLRTMAQTLKRLPSNQVYFSEEIDDLCEELRAIATKVRGGRQCGRTKPSEVRLPLC